VTFFLQSRTHRRQLVAHVAETPRDIMVSAHVKQWADSWLFLAWRGDRAAGEAKFVSQLLPIAEQSVITLREI